MQTYTSANTSINSKQVPAVFKKVNWSSDSINFDLGGGKYDTATEYLDGLGVTNLIYDPYNRSRAHNDRVLAIAINHRPDSCTISNVLNVIMEPDVRTDTLRFAKAVLKSGGSCFITVYEGDKSGVGRVTKGNCYQNNKRLAEYIDEVRNVFGNALIYKGMIIAEKKEA